MSFFLNTLFKIHRGTHAFMHLQNTSALAKSYRTSIYNGVVPVIPKRHKKSQFKMTIPKKTSICGWSLLGCISILNVFLIMNCILHLKGYKMEYIVFDRRKKKLAGVCLNRLGEQSSLKFSGFSMKSKCSLFYINISIEIRERRKKIRLAHLLIITLQKRLTIIFWKIFQASVSCRT